MTEWIVTSCVLILIVTGLRFALKGRIGLRLQYSLWLFVLLRLLIPFSIPSPLSIMNVIPAPAAPGMPALNTQAAPTDIPEALPQFQYTATNMPEPPTSGSSDTPISLGTVLTSIWVAGMCVTALVLVVSNLHFALRLRRTRRKVSIADYPLSVYQTGIVATPCLFGFLKPSVYVTCDVPEGRSMSHVLAHELTHFRHLDHIWSFLRCICLVLHWYNPLVWMAAILSKQDAELACDEAAIEKLGEDQRADYGQTLIGMTCVKRDLNTLFLTATMVGSKKALKERIRLIVKHPRTPLYTLLILCLTVGFIIACVFTGQQTQEQLTGPYGRLVYLDDNLYAFGLGETSTPNKVAWVLAGSITKCDPDKIPSEQLASTSFPVGTNVYHAPGFTDYIYVDVPWGDRASDMLKMVRVDPAQYQNKPLLTLSAIKKLVRNHGESLSWEHFKNYRSHSHSTGLTILDYQIQDADYYLTTIEHYPDGVGMIGLTSLSSGASIDLRTCDIDDFLLQEAARKSSQKEKPLLPTPNEVSAPVYLDDGIQACFVKAADTVYIWDYTPNSAMTADVLAAHIIYLGDVAHNDPYTMPAESFAACRLPAGTKLYKGSDIYGNYRSDILYCKPCPGSDDPESFGRFIPEKDIRGDDRWWETETKAAAMLTVDALKALVAEKGKLLYASDFENYTQVWFGDTPVCRVLPVEGDYRLFLRFHSNPSVEVLQAQFYHIDSPENVIDPLTDSIDGFLERQ